MLSVEAASGTAALAALSDDWRRLGEALGHRRFCHWHGWWRCALDSLEPDPEAVTFFVLRRRRRPLAILPLKRESAGPAGLGAVTWRLPAHPHLPLADALIEPRLDAREWLVPLLRALEARGGWDALRFEPVLAESPLARLAAAPRRGVHVAVAKPCAEVATAATGEDYRARLSRNFRSNLNKARHKLERERGVEFGAATAPAELERALPEFLALEASGWKGAQGAGTAIRLHPDLLAFYRGLVAELAPQGRVVVNTLRVAGRLVAGQFCLRGDGTLYVLKLAYDEDWSRVAPGNLLLGHVIGTARAAAGIEHVNLVGDPPWFRDWRPQCQDALGLWLTADGLRGRALSGLLGLKRRLRPVVRRLRPLAPAARA